MTSFYLAGRYARRDELKQKATELELRGLRCASRWLTTHDGVMPMERAAKEDVEDVLASDLVISFTEAPLDTETPSTGGRHVEFGIAYMSNLAAASLGQPLARLILVGPRENVFHYLPDTAGDGTQLVERYDTWEEAKEALTPIHRSGLVLVK